MSRWLTKYTLITLIVGLFVGAFAYYGIERMRADTPSWLFVVHSSSGVLKPTSDGQYQLTLRHENIERIVAFTDRPYRIVQDIKVSTLEGIWGKGTNSFHRDPPNAGLLMGGRLYTVIITGMKSSSHTVVYTLKVDDANKTIPVTSGASALFIDAE